MRALLVSTYDRSGGAGIASLRLHRGLLDRGLDSRLLVQSRRGDDPGVVGPEGPFGHAAAWVRPRLDTLPARAYPRRRTGLFSAAWLPDRLLRNVAAFAPDLVHLHWINHGMVRIESLPRVTRPLVWTLHDAWAFTGGCHLPFDCTQYREACGSCPALGSRREDDLSRRVWARKRESWRGMKVTVVTPSRWLADAVRSSALLRTARCEVIPNGVDLDHFRPLERATARARFKLPLDRRVVLCGGAGIGRDIHKGMSLLAEALRGLPADRRAALELLVFGTLPGDRLPAAGVATRDLGFITDQVELTALFAAADVYINPSRHENLPNTVMEAMACGTPCVAFSVGGLPELIAHRRTGWLAPPFRTDELARGIAWVLEDEARRRALGAQARSTAEAEFGIGRTVGRYVDLYRDVLGGARVA